MGRPARQYKYPVDVYEYIAQPDGYGGNVATQNVLIGTVWADAEVLSAENLTDVGLDQYRDAVRFNLRVGDIDYTRNDLVFAYRGLFYKAFSIGERTPGVEYEILAGAIE